MIRFPNAKINLGLHVIARREDGFHNLETLFYPIELKDALEIIPMHDDKAPNRGNGYQLFQTGIPIQGKEEENLVVKAWKLIASENSCSSCLPKPLHWVTVTQSWHHMPPAWEQTVPFSSKTGLPWPLVSVI
jgi:4-diphosphocytidyl-2C-methyl-D-erythritol kinase